MRIVVLSDTHEKHNIVSVPDGDVLLHAGDFTYTGELRSVEAFNEWLGGLPHKHKIITCGNHDLTFDPRKSMPPEREYVLGLLTNCILLDDSGCEIEGVKFWGSPISPEFNNWAFNRRRGNDIRKHWDLIPADTDVLITHGPPLGMLDDPCHGDWRRSQHLGCWDLADVLGLHPFQERRKIHPRLHVFGHIHGSGGKYVEKDGSVYVNASVLDEAYGFTNDPLVFDLWPGCTPVHVTEHLKADDGSI